MLEIGSDIDYSLKEHTDSVFQLIEDGWNTSGAWTDHVSAMRLVIPKPSNNEESSWSPLRWVTLPGLCCYAVGGELESTLEISAAWLLLYTSAHIVDTIEDGDYDPQVSKLGGPGVAINTANGLFLSAIMQLQSLHEKDIPSGQITKIISDYLETILLMTSGQHLDLTVPMLDLDQWWQIAETKSGAFFSLACRAGARLETADPDKIDAYSIFGYHLGLLLQIFDDLQDFQTLLESRELNPSLNLEKSLASAYAYDVLPETTKVNFRRLVGAGTDQDEMVDELIEVLDGCGAGLYMISEINKHQGLGIASLEKGKPLSPAGEELKSILHGFKLD